MFQYKRSLNPLLRVSEWIAVTLNLSLWDSMTVWVSVDELMCALSVCVCVCALQYLSQDKLKASNQQGRHTVPGMEPPRTVPLALHDPGEPRRGPRKEQMEVLLRLSGGALREERRRQDKPG